VLAFQFMDAEQASELFLKGRIELTLITLPNDIKKPLNTIKL
jgi:hypothetical protein